MSKRWTIVASTLCVAAACGEPLAVESSSEALRISASLPDGPLVAPADCPGEEICNQCVDDVVGQFTQLTASYDIDSWLYRRWPYNDTPYPPSNLNPADVYRDNGIQENHVQGFVRTAQNYAFTFNDDSHGTLTFVDKAEPKIVALHQTEETHPSGLFSIGMWVGLISNRTHIQFYTERNPKTPPIQRELPPGNENVQPGQGAAMVKLQDGHLLMVTQKIGNDYWNYWNILRGPSAASPPTEAGGSDEFLGGAIEPQLNQKEWQNASLITECGTGNVYAIHVTGDDAIDIIVDTSGDAYWNLSQVHVANGKPYLRSAGVPVRTVSQEADFCWTRGGASAAGDRGGALHLVCSSRSSSAGVLGFGTDEFGIGDHWLELKQLPDGPHGTGDRLDQGQVLSPDESLTSRDGSYQLLYQRDGNVVLYRTSNNEPLWASETRGSALGVLTMQTDGNLVAYSSPSNGVVWAAGTQGNPGSYLIVQNDGNAVIYSADGKPIWATETRQ